MKDHLKSLAQFFAVILLIYTVTAIWTAGWSVEKLQMINEILRWLMAALLFIIGILLICYFFTNREKEKWAKESRQHCARAYQELFNHLQEHSLEGFNNPQCRFLHLKLEVELDWYCQFFPEECWNSEIERFRRYSEKVKELTPIK